MFDDYLWKKYVYRTTISNVKYQDLTSFPEALYVVYFDHCFGAWHPKRWLKQSFSAFFVLKS